MLKTDRNPNLEKPLSTKGWTQQVEDDFWTSSIEPIEPKTFKASITMRQAGGYSLATVYVDPHILKRELKHIRRSEIADVLLIMPTMGTIAVGHGHDRISLNPSDICLVNGWEPYSIQVDEYAEILTFRMPCSALEARSKISTKELTFKRIQTQKGITRITASSLAEAFKQLEYISRGQDRVLLNNLASVVCAGLQTMSSQDVERSTYHEQLIRSIRKFIENNIEDENLNSKAIAQAHNISVRYLNKIFEAEPDTAIKYIRSLRLRLFAQRLLIDTTRSSTIKEIVFGCGFSDYAHFHRSFKKYFQCTPNEYRNSHK